MDFLVAYASIEGQTRKIAGRVAERIETHGHQVVLADLREPGYAVPGRFDAVLLCAPIHIGRFPEPFERFATDFASALNDKPSALISVSLGIASEHREERQEVQDIAARFCERTGWSPSARHDAAGALKYLEYDFFKRWIMRRIAAKEGGPVDTYHDHELTDWGALEVFVDDFLAGMRQ